MVTELVKMWQFESAGSDENRTSLRIYRFGLSLEDFCIVFCTCVRAHTHAHTFSGSPDCCSFYLSKQINCQD